MNVAHRLHKLMQLENEAFVAELYGQLLKRGPDPEGADSHLRQLQIGQPKHDVITAFMLSEEALELFNRPDAEERDSDEVEADVCDRIRRLFAKDPESFVHELFRELLGREPDEDNCAHYISLLSSGHSKSAVFAGFAESAEFTQLISLDPYTFAKRTLDQLIMSFYQ